VRVWDTNKGTSIYTGPWTIADTPADSLLERFALAWSPREPLLAIGDEQKTQLWKPGNSQPVQTHSDWQGHIVAWSGDGATLAGAGPAAGAWRCDPVSGKRLTSLPGQPQLRPVAIYWSPDGKYLVLRGDLTLWVWDATAGTLYRTLPRSARQFRDIAWSPDSRRLAYRLVDGRTVYVWDLAANKVQNGYTAKENLTALAWSPDAKRLALGTAKPGAIFLWTVGADKQATTLQSPEGSPVSALAWSPDGTALASADAVVRIWNVAAKKVVQTLRPSGTTAVVAWSPTGRYVATGGTENGALRLWDPKTEKPLHELKGLVGSARELLWMADGKTLAARGSDRALRLWDADSGALLRTLNPPTPGRNYLPEHGLLSASSPSYTLRCRELGTGRPYATFAFFHPSEPAAYLTVTAEGHYQAPAALEGELVYVAATEAGMDVLKPDAFAAKYQWKNDRGAVRFAPVGSVRKE
jgi:WD40 repeat protein